MRIGVDVATIPAPPDGPFSMFFGRDEIDVQLVVPSGTEVPEAWAKVLTDLLVRQIGFTSVEEGARTRHCSVQRDDRG